MKKIFNVACRRYRPTKYLTLRVDDIDQKNHLVFITITNKPHPMFCSRVFVNFVDLKLTPSLTTLSYHLTE